MPIKSFFFLFFSISTAFAQGYSSREIMISSDAGGNVGVCNLGATLLMPALSPAKSLILFVHGSGTTNRDELTPGGNHPFKDIAESLSQNGFATLRFDKRGIQPECRPPLINNQDLSPWNYIQDIRNIITFIKNDSEMSPLPLILLGHSEGVNFITEISASGVSNLKGVILLAGLGKYAIDETILRQYRELLQTPGLPPSEKAKIKKLIDDGTIFFGKIHNGSILASDSYMSVFSKYWADWIKISQEGAITAHQLTVPSLVVRGTLDTNVTEEDFDALKNATQNIPESNSFAPVGLDHYFSAPGSTNVSSLVLNNIASWLQSLK